MDAFATARSALPAWTGFAGLLYWPAAIFVISFLVAWGISFAGLRRLRRAARRKVALHWTERARVSYPVRVTLGVGFFVVFLVPLVLSSSFQSPFARTPGWLTALAVVLASWAGFLAGGRTGSRLIPGEDMPLRERVRNSAVITFLYLPLLILFAILAGVMPERMDGRAWVLLAVGAAAMALVVWRSGVPVLRLLRLARPASERLRRAVDLAAERVGKRPAAVWEVDWTAGNAIALVYSNELVFTVGTLRLLDDEQLATVAAHEIGHLSEPLRVKAVRTLSAWALLALATAAPVYRTYGWTGLGLLYFGFLAVVVGLRRLARRMEVRADAIGRDQEAEAGVYARALERLYEHNLAPAVVRGRLKVHPALWDRMTAAGVQPDYPRPAPPSRGRTLGLYLLLLILFAAGWVTADQIVPRVLLPRLLSEEQSLAFQIGLNGDLYAVRRLATIRFVQDRQEEAAALWGAAAALER
jgi:Zn-dependent protease with chaperone function